MKWIFGLAAASGLCGVILGVYLILNVSNEVNWFALYFVYIFAIVACGLPLAHYLDKKEKFKGTRA